MSVTTRECKVCGDPGAGRTHLCGRCETERSEAARLLGRLGGLAGRGRSKARSSEQAAEAGRRGAAARWGRRA